VEKGLRLFYQLLHILRKMNKVKDIKAKEILDSRGNSTVEVKLTTNKGVFKASVPAGASTGKYEAKALKASKAVENINKVIAPKIIGKNPAEQKKIDGLLIKLDGIRDKSKLGANAILAVSIAVCRAGAASKGLSLHRYLGKNKKMPLPCFNIINGGAHAKNDLDIQEFMIIPQKKSFAENLKKGKEIYNNLKKIINKEFGRGVKIGDEGGFAPLISKTKEALDLLMKSGKGFKIGLDCAASQFYRYKKYHLEGEVFTPKILSGYYKSLIKKYPIVFLEDPFGEEDWIPWRNLKIKALLIGDDLTVTNKNRVEKAIKEKCLGGIIIKPNQVGTVTETLESVKIAKKAGLKIMVSHRSGETMDDFIADLAVGIGADYIKSGAPGPKERMAKYSRLLKIEKTK